RSSHSAPRIPTSSIWRRSRVLISAGERCARIGPPVQRCVALRECGGLHAGNAHKAPMLGMSIRAVTRTTGVSKTTVSSWSSMQAWPPDRLRAILGVSKLVAPLHTDSLAVANRDKHKHIHALKQRIAEAVVLGSIGGFLRDGVATRFADQGPDP